MSITVRPGLPRPKGAIAKREGINFALFTRHAERVTLVLQLGEGPGKGRSKRIELPLDPSINRTGNIWHILVQGLPADFRYGYRLAGTL